MVELCQSIPLPSGHVCVMFGDAVKVPSPFNPKDFITLYPLVVTLRDVTGQKWRCKVCSPPRT